LLCSSLNIRHFLKTPSSNALRCERAEILDPQKLISLRFVSFSAIFFYFKNLFLATKIFLLCKYQEKSGNVAKNTSYIHTSYRLIVWIA
jgi:hypothetical protein